MTEKKKAENKKKLVSRREFLAAGGAVIAAGALSACTPKTTTETVMSTETNTKTATSTVTQTAPPQTTTVTGAAVTSTTTKTATTTATTTAPATTVTKTTQVEKTYGVVSPLGDRVVTMITMAPRLDTLAGKTICIHGTPDFNAPITHPVIQQVLQQQFPTAKIIPYTEMPGFNENAKSNSSYIAPFVQACKDKGAAAVIAGNGG
jgi:hypothetical protein